MSIRLFIPVGIAGLLAAGIAQATTPINQTRALNDDGLVSIGNVKGKIVVRTWAQPQVRITGTLGDGVEKLIVEGDARSLHIEVKNPEDHGWKFWSYGDGHAGPSTLEVTVPQHASLDLDAVSADIDVQQMAGRKLTADNVSGNTRITASSPGEIHVDAVSGDVVLRVTTAKSWAETVSGNIDLQGGLTGDVHLETVSGDMRLVAGQLDNFKLDTVSGDADLRFGLGPAGVAKGESLSGDIVVALAAGSNARLHVETFSGDIRSFVGSVRKDDGPGRSLDARIGDGQGQINLESFSGDVTVKRDSPD
jgi:hypothetical protein